MSILRQIVPASARSLPWRFRWLSSTDAFGRAPISSSAKLLRWTALELMNRDANFVTGDGHRMRSMTRNFTSLAVYLTGERDRDLQAFIKRHIKPGGTFIDVGANVGVYTVFASGRVGATGRVLAIEANPSTYRYLENNIRLNNLTNVTLANCAVGDAPGELKIAANNRNAGETHIAAGDESGVSVPVERIDDLLPKHGITSVDYMKIDVEGFELPVLRGALSIIDASPNIAVQTELVEAHAQRYGYSIKTIIDLMIAHGLKPFSASPDGQPIPMNIDDIGKDWDVLWMRSMAVV